MRTFSQITRAIAEFFEDHHPDTLQMIKSEVNLEYQSVAREQEWVELIAHFNGQISFAQGRNYIALPGDAVKIKQIAAKGSTIVLRNEDLERVAGDNIGTLDSNGTPVSFAELGLQAIKRPLPIDTEIKISSSSASDTEGNVRIVGLDENDLRRTEELALSGTSETITTIKWKSGWSLASLSTDRALNGVVTVTEPDTPATIAQIPPQEKASAYFIVILDNPPATAEQLHVIYKRGVEMLRDDDDIPAIPVDGYLIERVKGKMRQVDRKYVQAREHFGESQAQLRAVLSEQRLQSNKASQARPDFRGRGLQRVF